MMGIGQVIMFVLLVMKIKKKKTSLKYSTLEKRVDLLFSKYIRQRDKGICFTCGSKKGVQAGHFIKRNHKRLRFNLTNVHAQCVKCNHFLHGNDQEYIQQLIKYYGTERLMALFAKKNEIVRLNRYQLLKLEKWLKEKLNMG